MDLKAGARLRSATSSAEFVVVRPPSEAAVLECAGSPLGPPADGSAPAPAAAAADGDAVLLGKRYVDDATNLELLCTKAGAGPLVCDGRPMPLKEAKPLPSSD